MKTFKELLQDTEIPWLDWDASHASFRHLVKPINEDSIPWKEWSNTTLNTNPVFNKHNSSYDSNFHDHPDIIPQDHDTTVPAINHYSSATTFNPTIGHATSTNINGHLRYLSGVKHKSNLLQLNHGISGDFSPTKVQEAIRSLSDTFTPENTNRIPVQVYAGIPPHIAKTLDKSKVGSIHYNPGFQSTTSNPKIAVEYAKVHNIYETDKDDPTAQKHIIHYYAHPGSIRSIAHHSQYSENESLINHGTKMEYQGSINTTTQDGTPLKIYRMVVHNDRIPLEKYKKYKST